MKVGLWLKKKITTFHKLSQGIAIVEGISSGFFLPDAKQFLNEFKYLISSHPDAEWALDRIKAVLIKYKIKSAAISRY